MLQFIRFEVIGVLFATDLMLLAALPIVLARNINSLKNRQVGVLLSLGMAWLASQIATDLIRESTVESYTRGWTKILLTLTHFVVLWCLLRRSNKRIMLYAAGLSAGTIAAVLISPTELMRGLPWKFGCGIPVTILIALFATRLRKYRAFTFILFCAVALIHLAANFRSFAIISFLAGIFVFSQRSQPPRTYRQAALGRSLLVVLFLTAGIAGFIQLYSYAAQSGQLGEEARVKYEQQQGAGGLLLGGRSEILVSSEAIMDSPILGHGSWAHDSHYKWLIRQRRAELGYKKLPDASTDDLIPTHSHLFGAWVEAGLAGAVFWSWILVMVISVLRNVSGEEPLLPLFALIGFLLCWNILFSPYGAERRFDTTYFFVVFMILREHQKAGVQGVRFVKGLYRNNFVQSV